MRRCVTERRSAASLALIVALGFAVLAQLADAQQKTVRQRQTMAQAAADAERRGATEVTYRNPVIIDYPGINSLEDINDEYSVLRVVPEAASAVRDENTITTLYTVRVIDSLQRATRQKHQQRDPFPNLPAVGAGKLLVQMVGGSIAIKGVTVRQPGTQLDIGRTYLLIVGTAGRLSYPATGDSSVFRVGPGDSIEPLSDSLLAMDLRSRGLTNVGALQAALRSRRR